MSRTVGDVIRDVSGQTANEKLRAEVAEWPADVFALTAAILSESGAYRLIVSPPPQCAWPGQDAQVWARTVEQRAQEWMDWVCRDQSAATQTCPVENLIAKLFELHACHLSDLEKPSSWNDLCTLATLHAIADESCANVGLGGLPPHDDAVYVFRANDKLVRDGSLSNFDTSHVRVLPKMRTPQTGISIRSLSLYASAVRCEVDAKWLRREFPGSGVRQQRLRMLLFPWPLQIETTAFVPASGQLMNMDEAHFGFFDFEPRYATNTLIDTFRSTLATAQREVGEIDLVVLPEGAVVEAEFDALWDECVRGDVHMLLAGVRGPGRNEARLKLGRNEPESVIQHKHHRWCLDGTQITNYEIGASLNPAVRWWERVDLRQRALTFVTMGDWITLCHLICEDLARIDPVAQVVRAVGRSSPMVG